MKYHKTLNAIKITFSTLILVGILSSCSKDEPVYEKTRLFRPVQNADLKATANVIIVNLAKIKEAISYKVEVSQDSFVTVLYTFVSDTNYILINQATVGEELDYNSLYQVRVLANAASSEYNSKVALLGSVRTERFPSIQLLPRIFDVTDVKARARWTPSGAAISQVKTFAKDDKKLTKPLATYTVSAAENTSGEKIIDKLTPNTSYQVAIYSGNTIRGWVDYKTLVADVNPADPNVINLSESEDPSALASAVAAAADGNIILLKKGIRYDIPTDPLNKSITIKGAYGLVPERTEVFSKGDWKVTPGAKINYIIFDNIDFIGLDMGAHYAFNISNSGTPTVIKDLKFLNCTIKNVRGIIRLRSTSFITNLTISNSIVYDIGNYGLFTCDSDGTDQAAIDNVLLENSTFYRMTIFVTSRQNCQSFIIKSCTFSEFTEQGQQTFRFRGAAGKSDIINGLTISGCIWGHGWDPAKTGGTLVSFSKDGLKNTTISVTNTWATSDFGVVAGTEMPGFPSLTYGKPAASLWVSPYMANFNIGDAGFTGKYDSGDPRWRTPR